MLKRILRWLYANCVFIVLSLWVGWITGNIVVLNINQQKFNKRIEKTERVIIYMLLNGRSSVPMIKEPTKNGLKQKI